MSDPHSLPNQTADRGLFWLLVACCSVMLTIMSWPTLVGKIYVQDDLWAAHYPMKHFYWNCLQNGYSFSWMPDAFCGFDFVGWGEGGTYHPLKWALYRLIPWPTAFNVDLLWSYPFMLVGMYLFLRRHLARRDACLFGAMVFTFSGFSLLHFVHPTAISVISHYPWLLLALDVAATERRLRSRVFGELGIAVLTASQILLGHPQYVWIGLAAQAFYCAYLVCSRQLQLRSLWLIVVPSLIGLTIGSIQVLPTWDALANSTRTATGADFAMTGSMHPLNLVQLVEPYLFESRVVGWNTHEFGIYFGTIPLILVTWLIITFRQTLSSKRSLIIAFVILAVIALWLMLGKYGGLYFFQTWLPVIGKFRFPARYGVLLHFAIAVLAAIAFERMRTSGAQNIDQRLSMIGGCLAATGLALAVGFSISTDPDCLAPWWLMVAGPISLAIAAGILWIRTDWIWIVLVVFTAVDLGVYGFSYAVLQVKTESEALAEIPIPMGIPSERVLVENQFMKPGVDLYIGNVLVAAGHKQADGYLGLAPHIELLGSNVTLKGLQVAGVGWVLNRGQNSSIDGLQRFNETWLRVPSPLPRVRLVPHVRQSDGKFWADLAGIDPSRTALIEKPLTVSATILGNVQLVTDRPGEIEVTVSAAEPQLLVLAERYDSGWELSINGQQRDVIRVYRDFMGCVVGPRDEKVHFSFRPWSHRMGRILCYLGLLFLVSWVALRLQFAGERDRLAL